MAGRERSKDEGVAVAIKDGEPGSPQTGSPRIVASGRGAIAEQILNIAFDRGVKVRQDADLAQVLAALDCDADIPPAAMAAIAEILTYVYLAQGRARPLETPASS